MVPVGASPLPHPVVAAIFSRMSRGYRITILAGNCIKVAVDKTLAEGFPTRDIATDRVGETKVGTTAMGDAISARL